MPPQPVACEADRLKRACRSVANPSRRSKAVRSYGRKSRAQNEVNIVKNFRSSSILSYTEIQIIVESGRGCRGNSAVPSGKTLVNNWSRSFKTRVPCGMHISSRSIPYTPLHLNTMATFPFHNDLLAPYLALPQGGKVQAECEYP